MKRFAGKWAKVGLTSRIVWAFLLLMVATALAYGWALMRVVEFTEEHLMTRGMSGELKRIERVLLAGHRPFSSEGRGIYGEGGWAEGLVDPLPEACRRAPMGFSEVVDDPALFVMKRTSPSGTLCLTLDQSAFEAQEQWIERITWASVIFVMLAAALTGGLLATAVIRPINALSKAVREQVGAETYHPLRVAVSQDEIGELARISDRALRELYDVLEREKAFTGDVSHELRTPLMVVESSAELLQLTELTPKQRELVERIERSGQNMRELIELFLELSRGERADGAGAALSRSARLGDVVDALAAEWGPKAAAKGIEMIVLTDAGGGKTELLEELVPARHAETVLRNLLKNAVRYTAAGRVLLDVAPEGCFVADTGPGVPAGEAERIFAPHERGRAAQGAAKGFDLGLSIALKVADRCGWRLRLVDAAAWAAAHPDAANRLTAPQEEGAPRASVGAVFMLDFCRAEQGRRRDERGGL